MFDRLSSLVIALTLLGVAAIFAELAGGDAATIAILTLAGLAAAAIVHAATPAVAAESPLEPPESPLAPPPPSLLPHPDFARWPHPEPHPRLAHVDNIVHVAHDAATPTLARHNLRAPPPPPTP